MKKRLCSEWVQTVFCFCASQAWQMRKWRPTSLCTRRCWMTLCWRAWAPRRWTDGWKGRPAAGLQVQPLTHTFVQTCTFRHYSDIMIGSALIDLSISAHSIPNKSTTNRGCLEFSCLRPSFAFICHGGYIPKLPTSNIRHIERLCFHASYLKHTC